MSEAKEKVQKILTKGVHMKKLRNEKIKQITTAGLIGMCCLGVLWLGGCSTTELINSETVENLPQIIVGSDNYPPFNYIDTDGEATGIDVDLAKEAFKRMGYEPVFTLINWEDKKELLSEGQIDCVWGCFSIDGRENDYQWAGPYMISRQVVAVDEASDIDQLSDLDGKIIAVQSTTKPEEVFRNHSNLQIPELQEVISLQNRELIYSFLSKGYVDAVAAHETAILQYMSDYDVSYRILEEPLLKVGLGVAFDKNDDRGLDQELTQIFREMQRDGTEEEIIGQYLENPEKYLEVDAYGK